MFSLFLAVITILILGTSKLISSNRNLHSLTDIGHYRNSVSKVCSNRSSNYGKLCIKTPEGDKEGVTEVRKPPKRAERPVRTWKLSGATTGKQDIQKDALCSSLCRRAQPPLQATKVSTQSKPLLEGALWHKIWMEYFTSICLMFHNH